MKTNLPIILGSQSPWRQGIMRELGWQFTVMTADIDEKQIRDDTPEKMVVAIAKAKAAAILPKISEPSILITADQVVRCNGEIREKPVDEDQAREFLESYKFYSAETISSIVVTNTQTGKQVSGIDLAKIYFKPLPKQVIDALIDKGDVFKSAGGFIHEDSLLSQYIDHLEGTSDSIDGLPLALLEKLITEVS
ncbi:MAG: Maf family protein [Candidatus Parcubacteria bacterium]|nr:Maf family protein [Candidatus Parcubacteria bacterium]